MRSRLDHVLNRTWDRAVHQLAGALYALPPTRPARFGVQLIRDVAYAPTGSRAHLLDVYRPMGKARGVPVLYVHGGGFAVLSKDTHRVMALAFASRGYTVFNVNYHLGPRYHYPVPLDDVSMALDWVAKNAGRYGADPRRVVLAGESAGANLVTALAYAATHPRPEPFAKRVWDAPLELAAVVPVYGLHDMHDLERFAHPRLSRLLRAAIVHAAASYVGRPVALRAAEAPLASPLRLLRQPAPPDARPLPPFFIACGTADPLLIDSKALLRALRSRGVTCDLSVHPREIHGFNAMVWRKEARAKWRALFDFLDARVPSRDRSGSGLALEGSVDA